MIEEKGISNHKISRNISEYKYEYKTSLDRQEEIVMSSHSMKSFESPVALF